MKVLFASGSMQGGGAERVTATLANELVNRGIDITILIVCGESAYKLDNRIDFVRLYGESEITSAFLNKLLRRFTFYFRLISRLNYLKPDVIVPVHGGGWNALFVIFGKILGIKVVAAEHIAHTAKPSGSRLIRWFEKRYVYQWGDALVVISRFDERFYSHYIKNVFRIPNPIEFEPIKKVEKRQNLILAAGRLNAWYHKGFDNLLIVFSKVAGQFPDWRLQIAGTGEVGEIHLRSLAKELEIEKKVDFLGFRDDINNVMQSSSIFVLSSRFEGFGMVLLEAMSQGCACISFDCEAGPSDIIENNVDGLLIENQNNEVMANALSSLMHDEQTRLRLSTGACAKAASYSPSLVVAKWIVLFKSLGMAV